jgi:O-antigen/teichoic acid export membrane protein
LGTSLLSGALWSVGIRWVGRVLGFVSLAICARVLTPADYGLVNMAMVVVGLFNVFTYFGIDAALLRKSNCTPEDYNSAWTLKVAQGAILGALIAAAAPFAQDFYRDDRVGPILLCVAACIAINGTANIYVVDFRKNLDFRTDFVINILPRLFSVAIAITLALTLRTYWALVVSICSTYISWVVASYVMCRKRPTWSLSSSRELLSFSTWYFAQGLAGFLMTQADRLLLGPRLGPSALGTYVMARETATLPNTEVTLPFGRALFPTLARLVGDQHRFRTAALNVIGAVVTVIAPVSVALSITAPDVIAVLLGSQWSSAAPLVSLFALGGLFGAIRIVTNHIMTTLGLVRLSAGYAWLEALLLLGLLLPAYSRGGSAAVAGLAATVSFLMTFVQFAALHYAGVVTDLRQLRFLGRPLTAVAAMAAAMLLVPIPADIHPFASLVGACSVGAIVYGLVTVGLVMQAAPDAHERLLLATLLSGPAGRLLPKALHRRLAPRAPG